MVKLLADCCGTSREEGEGGVARVGGRCFGAEEVEERLFEESRHVDSLEFDVGWRYGGVWVEVGWEVWVVMWT